jgi:tape measure domain-containing protein
MGSTMSDESEFKLQFDASEARRAAAAASDVDKLADSLDHLRVASAKVPAKTLPGLETPKTKTVAMSAALQEQIRAMSAGPKRATSESLTARLNGDLRKMAPLSKSAAVGLRMLGVSGAPLRKVAVDAAKTEVVLRRLFRMNGGGVKGAASVLGALGKRGLGSVGGLPGIGGALASGAGSVAATVGGAAATGGAVVGAAALAGVVTLGVDMTQTALKAEQLRFALDRITDGKGQQWWQTSSEYAQKFGLDVNEVAQNLMGMKASGFSDELARTMFQQFADMRSQGAASENIANALLGLKQLRAAGKATAEDLNQVTENLSLSKGLVWEQLAKNLGKSAQEARKMQEAGNVTSEQMIQAISQAIGIQTKSAAPGEAGAASVNSTTLGAWEKLKATFSVRSADAISGDALKPMRDGIVSFTDWLNGTGGKAAISGFGGMVGRIFEGIPVVVEKVIWLFDTGLPAAWGSFTASFSSSGGSQAIESISAGFGAIGGENGQAAIANLEGIGSAAGQLAGSLVTLTGYLVSTVEWLGKLGSYSDTINTFMWFTPLAPAKAALAGLDWITSGTSIGTSMADGVAAGIDAGIPSATAAATRLASATDSAMRVEAQVHSPGRKAFSVGGHIAEGLSLGMDRGSSDVYNASVGMGRSAHQGVVESLGIHSPSREMGKLVDHSATGYVGTLERAQPWARDAGAGLGNAAALGVTTAQPMAAAPMIGSAAAIREASYQAPSTTQSAGTTNMVQVEFTVRVEGGADSEKAQSVGRDIVRGAEPEFAAMMRRLNYSM